ncbi:MAG: agmatinase [Vulcanimicrobiota bacterium]
MIPDNFLGIPEEYSGYEKSNIVILPVPFEKTSSWVWGSDKGPRAIINASKNLEVYDIETNSQVYKKGIHTADFVTAVQADLLIEKVSLKVAELLDDNKFVITLGGEHTVSVAPVRAFSQKIDNLSVLHLDAHADYRSSYMDDPYSHACAMYQASQYVPNIVSVGIRSMDVSELENINKDKMFFAHRIQNNSDWINSVVDELSENVYATIDLDVFDPSIMPSTGTPEPGGLLWYDVLKLLKTLCQKKKLVGFDVVELCPAENPAPDFLAAKLIYKILSYKFNTETVAISI